MKITVYTIKDCAFSKQEKEYLNTNKLVFEEKDLETNKDFLTEMLAISNNFAGTPVTRVEKEDGTIAVLKGFTKEEFDKTFGFASPAEASAKAGSTDSTVPPAEAEVKPVVETPSTPPVEQVTPAPVPVEPTVVPEPPKADEQPLNDLMDKLNSKIDSPPPPPAPLSDDTTSSTTTSTTPPDAGAPTIPDFPAK